MPAGTGIGPVREKHMVDILVRWVRRHGKKRPIEVGGMDIMLSLAHLHALIEDGQMNDKYAIIAHRYLCLFVKELNEVLND
jgi:hypothetical protein